MKRKVTFIKSDERVNMQEVAEILAYNITGGDYEGFIQKCMERQEKKRER